MTETDNRYRQSSADAAASYSASTNHGIGSSLGSFRIVGTAGKHRTEASAVGTVAHLALEHLEERLVEHLQVVLVRQIVGMADWLGSPSKGSRHASQIGWVGRSTARSTGCLLALELERRSSQARPRQERSRQQLAAVEVAVGLHRRW